MYVFVHNWYELICLSVESEQLTRLVGSHITTGQELDRQINEFDNKEA